MKRQRPSSFQQPSPPHGGYDPPYSGYDAAASTAYGGYDPPYSGYDAAASTAPSSSSLYDNQVWLLSKKVRQFFSYLILFYHICNGISFPPLYGYYK
jgi:hypothetical protein